MLNRYSLWKYIALIIVIFAGFLYAIPNLYGEDPSIQITKSHGLAATNKNLYIIENILKNKNILYKSLTLKNGIILVRFTNTDMQLHANDIISTTLGKDYVTSFHLEPSTPKWLSVIGAKPMKFGLDLRGGVHFLMQIDTDTVLNKLQITNIDILNNELRQKGISGDFKKTLNYGIEINFKNSIIRNTALKYLKKIHREMLITSSSNTRLTIKILNKKLNEAREYAMQKNINVLRNRVNQLGVSESLVQRQGSNYIVVEIPGIQDIARAKDILGATATLEFRLVNNNINESTIFGPSIPNNSEIKYTSTGIPVVLYKHPIMNGNHIINSMFSMDQYNNPQVSITLDSIGGKIMSQFTKTHLDESMATLFVEYKNGGKRKFNGNIIFTKHEKIINVAKIKSRFSNNFHITGITDVDEARQLSLLLRSGSLVAPIQIVEEGTIGPSMGQQNIRQGIKACLCGLVASIVFMLIFYKKFGLIAINALLCNLVLIIAIMSQLPGVTLTMPGIAGIILTLAVAVDANVLINERIKEELRNGRSVPHAINEGYKGAFSSICDANVTTIIKVLILYTFGSNSIKGFALTTIIGVITSMFTAIIGTRAIVNIVYSNKHIKHLSI